MNSQKLCKILILLTINTIIANCKESHITKTIKQFGYNAETHDDCKTEDNYYLTLHRIRGKGKDPILFVHGFSGSAENFLYMQNESLPFLLTSLGYDIWLLNCRSVSYSQHSRFYKKKRASFWDFGLDEMGIYDIPAAIDYILTYRNVKQLIFIGHSQGTTLEFMATTDKPAYNDKIKLFVALGPAVYVDNLELPMAKPLLKGEGALKEYILQIAETLPDDVSTRQLLHYLQMVKTGTFCKYDFNAVTNLEKYGSAKPPCYPVRKMTAPIAIYYSDGDEFVSKENIERLINDLPNVVSTYRIQNPAYSHLDFLWNDANKKDLYPDIIKQITSLRI